MKSKYGGFRSVARMCQGAAISRMTSVPLSGCSRFQTFAAKRAGASEEIDDRGADRKDDRDQAFQQQADAQAGGQRNAQRRGAVLFGSMARRNAHIASAMVQVSMTSGIRMRVKRNKSNARGDA